MRARFRGNRGTAPNFSIPNGMRMRSDGDSHGRNRSFWISILALLGGAVVHDLKNQDSKLRSLSRRLFSPRMKVLGSGKEIEATKEIVVGEELNDSHDKTEKENL